MKTYRMTNPPGKPGIYLLTNQTTGQMYVGQSVNLDRRYREWKHVFNTGNRATNAAMLQVGLSGTADDWEFGVLLTVEPEQVNELSKLETMAIVRIRNRKPDALINVMGNRPVATPEQETGIPKSEVIGPDGSPMTHAEVAAHLNIQPGSVKKRLKALREKGISKMKLEDLM